MMTEDDLYLRFIKDPALWMERVLGTESIEEYQRRITKQIVEFDNVAIRACHSVGKTWLMARIALWFYSNFDNSIIITTAPTHRQVQKLLWGEIRDAYKNSLTNLGGRLLDTELKISDKHYAIGFSPQSKTTSTKEQQGSSFQGFHSDHVMILFDEATGVSPDVWIMAQGLRTSGKIVKFVCIANPTTKNCTFFSCFSSPDWKGIKISCFDSPNMIENGFVDKESLQDEIDRLSVVGDDERISIIQSYKKPKPYLLTAQFVVPYVMGLGMTHPLVMSKVFGEFPLDEDNVLVQYEDVVRAQDRTVEILEGDKRYIGVDVARFGADKTVLTEIVGYKHVGNQVLVKRDLTEVSGAVMRLLGENTMDTIVLIDSTGLGAGVFDILAENQKNKIIGKHVQLEEVHFGSSASGDDDNEDEEKQNKTRYVNLKSKIFDLLADDLKNSLDLLSDSVYQEELPSIQYKFDSKGRIVIESKDDYKKRTGRSSPDHSDSLALANFGRYVNMRYGSFANTAQSLPLVKQDKRKPRKPGIKVKEY